jgi:hypothetical protein
VGILVASSLAFLGARGLLPSDGTAIIFEDAEENVGGLKLAPITPSSSNLQDEDLLLTIEGRPVNEWLRPRIMNPEGMRLKSEDTLRYQIQRQDEILEFPIRLTHPSMGSFLEKGWGVYFFLFYLEAISLFVYLRSPGLGTSRTFLLLSSLIFASGLIFFLGIQASDLLRVEMISLWLWGSVILYGWLAGSLLHFALIFPSGTGEVRRQRWILPAIYAGVWIPYALSVAAGWNQAISNVARFQLLVNSTGWMTLTTFPLVLIISFRRYRITQEGRQRRQMRWILWGFSVASIPWLLSLALSSIFKLSIGIPDNIIGLLWCAVPTTFAIAILREGLFDIDILINRTLVYTLLSTTLALVYFISVVVFQNAIRALSGQSTQFAIVLSTLTIAALFNPLRGRLQKFIDRRFYRAKYDAEQTLALFAATARDEVDMERLTGTLLGVVENTMQPEKVSLWLEPIEHQTFER